MSVFLDENGDAWLEDDDGDVFAILEDTEGNVFFVDDEDNYFDIRGEPVVFQEDLDAEAEEVAAEEAAEAVGWAYEFKGQVAQIENRIGRELTGKEIRKLKDDQLNQDEPDVFGAFRDLIGDRDVNDPHVRQELLEEVAEDAMAAEAEKAEQADQEPEPKKDEPHWTDDIDPKEFRDPERRQEVIAQVAQESQDAEEAEAQAA